jgi:hypothetical protein
MLRTATLLSEEIHSLERPILIKDRFYYLIGSIERSLASHDSLSIVLDRHTARGTVRQSRSVAGGSSSTPNQRTGALSFKKEARTERETSSLRVDANRQISAAIEILYD